ncbi:GDSL-like Lipase/Acylhydrolase family [Myroides sp. A21]|uniref:hypothetical protein n=1 Tax=Myroides sp. A21 TaxID=1583100 RepID=UPI0005807848|nr:hypothetical protein [Myroides sp. A21]AJA67306.1 GDSL-like Lipase/Acylhydrolase family [Myroides sp. A21]
MIQPLKIQKKYDNDDKLAQIIRENIPANQFTSADDINAILAKINEMVPAINVSNGGFQGTLTINEKRVDSGFYIPQEDGVYINADNIVVDRGQGVNFVTYDGDKWEVAVVPLLADGQIEEGNMGFVSGGEIYSNITSNITRKSNNIVSAEGLIKYNSSVFENVIDSEIVMNNSYVGKLEFYQTNYLFSGFGCFFKKPAPFDVLKLWLIENSRSDYKVKKIGYRICIGDEKGRVLSQGTQDIELKKGMVEEITILLESIIEYKGDDNLWVEFYTDGIVGLCYGNKGVASQKLKYTVNGVFKDFSQNGVQQLTRETIDGIGLTFSLFNKFDAIPNENFKNDIISPSLIFDKNNKKDIVPASTIEEYYRIDSIREVKTLIPPIEGIIYKGKDYDRSTFCGWGQPIHKLGSFNSFKIIIDNWNVVFPISRVGFRICVGDERGSVLAYGEKNVSVVGKKEEIEFLFNLVEYTGDDNLWVEFYTDGACSFPLAIESDIPRVLRYKVYTQPFGDFSKGSTLVVNDPNYKQFYYQLGVLEKEVKSTPSFANSVLEFSKNNYFKEPSVLLNSKVFIYPGHDYNIYNKNVVVPEYGDNLHNYRLDFNGNLGVQFLRQYRLQKAVSNTISRITLDVLHGRNIISTHEQEIIIANINAGEGIVRNILGVGDSTLNAGTITKRIREVFNTDVMSVNFLGTRGNVGEKHEGRGGWTISDYYGIGRKFYVVPVSGIVTSPSIGSVYKQVAGNNFTVTEVNVTNGEGYVSLSMVSGSADLTKNGTLTKISGNGDNTINYSDSEITSQNPFYNPAIGKFDLAYYLKSTKQVLNDSDFVFFQLGINDVFGITTLERASSKVSEMAMQMDYIISNIHDYNSAIRVGIIVTFPPANQDAFGFSYSLGQTSEMYTKTGLITWQKYLLEKFDNELSRNNNIYLVAAHLNLDTDYNYPVSEMGVNSHNQTDRIIMQANGVHPSADGYYQIADMWCGLIKHLI